MPRQTAAAVIRTLPIILDIFSYAVSVLSALYFSLHKMSQLSFHTKHHHLRRIHHILYLEFLLPESSIGSPFAF